jgi:hypothetical protein
MMDYHSHTLTQRLRLTRRKLFFQTLTSSLVDCWFLFLAFALIWICAESLLFPANPSWINVIAIPTGFALATVGAVIWTIRTCPRPTLAKISAK